MPLSGVGDIKRVLRLTDLSESHPNAMLGHLAFGGLLVALEM